MKYIFLLGITSLAMGCSSNETSVKETVSIEELMGEVKESDVTDEKEIVEIIPALVSDGTSLSNLIVSISPKYDTISLSILHKMDRYGYNSFKKIRFSTKLDDDNSYADVYQYNFSDSLKLNNAFYNWLDCFGDKCSEIKIGEDIEKTKNSPSFTLVYDTILVSIKYNLDGKKINFKSFQDSILVQFGSQYRYAIQTDVRGNLNWK